MIRFLQWLGTARAEYHWTAGVVFFGAFPVPYFTIRLEANEPWKWAMIAVMATYAAAAWLLVLV